MKKLLAILLSLVMVMCLFAACDSGDDGDGDSKGGKNSSYEDVVKLSMKMYEGTLTKNDLKSIRPAEYWEDNDLEEEWEDAQATMESTISSMESYFGENFEVSYEIADKSEMDEERLEEIRSRLEEEYGIAPEDIEKGYNLTLEITFSGDDAEETNTMDFPVICIRGAWYPGN